MFSSEERDPLREYLTHAPVAPALLRHGFLKRRDRAFERPKAVGRRLFGELADALRERGMETMTLIVDDENRVGQRFYDRNGMKPDYPLTLHGRRMHRYVLPLQGMEPK